MSYWSAKATHRILDTSTSLDDLIQERLTTVQDMLNGCKILNPYKREELLTPRGIGRYLNDELSCTLNDVLDPDGFYPAVISMRWAEGGVAELHFRVSVYLENYPLAQILNPASSLEYTLGRLQKPSNGSAPTYSKYIPNAGAPGSCSMDTLATRLHIDSVDRYTIDMERIHRLCAYAEQFQPDEWKRLISLVGGIFSKECYASHGFPMEKLSDPSFRDQFNKIVAGIEAREGVGF